MLLSLDGRKLPSNAYVPPYQASIVTYRCVLNYPKSQLSTQEIDFLGFIVNSTAMELKLPGEKIKKNQKQDRQSPTISAMIIEKMSLRAATQAIHMAPLYLQCCLWEAGEREPSLPCGHS